MDSPVKLIIIGAVLLIVGVVLPWLMVLELVRSTLLLNLVAAMSSTGGLLMGFIGIAMYVRARK